MSEPRRAATDVEAKALASPLRLRILRICLGEAHTNREIADVLGKDPATTLHHVRTLAGTGFLAAQPTRRGARGSREIPYLATGRSWSISNSGASKTMLDAFLEEIALTPADALDATRAGLRLSAQQKEEFTTRFTHLVDEFRARPDAGDAEPWSVFLAVHPDPNRPP